jgi:DNA-binding MarR family transcriptional regulator
MEDTAPGCIVGGMVDLPRIFSDLVRVEIGLWVAVDARLRAEHGLPLTQFEPMTVIAGREGCRVQDVSDTLTITVGGASKLIDRIEAAGYCRRRANPVDRRSSLIALTAAGESLRRRASTTVQRELASRLGGRLPEDSLKRFGETLAQLRAESPATN